MAQVVNYISHVESRTVGIVFRAEDNREGGDDRRKVFIRRNVQVILLPLIAHSDEFTRNAERRLVLLGGIGITAGLELHHRQSLFTVRHSFDPNRDTPQAPTSQIGSPTVTKITLAKLPSNRQPSVFAARSKAPLTGKRAGRSSVIYVVYLQVFLWSLGITHPSTRYEAPLVDVIR